MEFWDGHLQELSHPPLDVQRQAVLHKGVVGTHVRIVQRVTPRGTRPRLAEEEIHVVDKVEARPWFDGVGMSVNQGFGRGDPVVLPQDDISENAHEARVDLARLRRSDVQDSRRAVDKPRGVPHRLGGQPEGQRAGLRLVATPPALLVPVLALHEAPPRRPPGPALRPRLNGIQPRGLVPIQVHLRLARALPNEADHVDPNEGGKDEANGNR
mmetsp:Transcript_2680/g.9190  ORF Transcript_2680/g.9190 Transcript_2680/m.9190 type:complete len:212 (-) Transcript_2680:138-773(-)